MRQPLALILLAATAATAAAQSHQVWKPTTGSYSALAHSPAIDSARAALEREPNRPESYIALARAQAGSWQMREAIATLSAGLERFPDHVELLRWRGHRYLSVREFDRATLDLERGLHFAADNYGLWYHIGIVRFIRGEFDRAAEAFESARLMPPDANEAAGSADWLYLSLLRAGRNDEARRLLRSLPDYRNNPNAYARRIEFYRGRTRAERLVVHQDTAKTLIATLRFGLAMVLLAKGDTAEALRELQQVLVTDAWASFAHIAATEAIAELNLLADRQLTWPGDFGPIPYLLADEANLSCLAAIPDQRMRRVNAQVMLALDPSEDRTPHAALLRDRFAHTLRTAIERYQRDATPEGSGAIPDLEPRLAWHALELGFAIVISRDGSFRLEPPAPRTDSPFQSDSSVALIAELLEGARAVEGGAVQWAGERAADTLTLRLGLTAPIASDGRVIDLFPAVTRIPLGMLRTPMMHSPRFEGGDPPEFPGLGRDNFISGNVAVAFVVNPDGGVDSSSVTSPPMTVPVPQSMRFVIDDYLRESFRSVRSFRFSPATVGGCPVSALLIQRFAYGFRP